MNRLLIKALLALMTASAIYAQTQAADATQSTDNAALHLPDGTLIFAKLMTPLDTAQCKAGDQVEAQVTHDVKDGSKTVIQKGALILGEILKAQASPDASGLYGIWVVFNHVTLKSGSPSLLIMDIRAIAPPSTGGTDNINGVDTTSVFMGHGSAKEGAVDVLTPKSAGALGFPGVNLAFQNANGAHQSLLVSKSGNFHLVKGSQIVFRVAAP